MSIIKMSKLRIVGMIEDKSDILNELYLSRKVQIKPASLIDGTIQDTSKETQKRFENDYSNTVSAMMVLSKFVDIKDRAKSIDCSFDEFLQIENKETELQGVVCKVNESVNNISKNYNEILKLRAEQLELVPVEIKNLSHVQVNSATLKQNKLNEETKEILDLIYKELSANTEVENEYEALGAYKDSLDNMFLKFNVKQEDYESVQASLNALNSELNTTVEKDGTVKIVYAFNEKSKQKLFAIEEAIKTYYSSNVQITASLQEFVSYYNDLKVYSDYLSYEIEKEKINENVVYTERTFVLECYIAKEDVKDLKRKLETKFEALVVNEEKFESGEMPPTKTKNNKLIKQAEFVTNMYSAPQYNEVDPNPTVFFFFVLFFGFIMADVGYGLIITILGYLFASKQKTNSGGKRLWTLIGTSGIFAIVWGVLFGSVFGFSNAQFAFIPKGVMPDPQNEPILLLLICLLMGIVQIACGYAIRGANAFKRGRYINGIVNGFAWVVFMLGVVFGASNYLFNFFKIETGEGFKTILLAVEKPGLIMIVSSLAIAVIFAGVGTKGFTKFTKSFSALYGIINLFSDILSYARLFGLMLSGAIIGQQFNNIALGLMTGPIGYIFGFIIMLIGHAFNIAMGALGAYIHTVRLQYIEYFGKFYNGEGTLFVPFGAKLNYVNFQE